MFLSAAFVMFLLFQLTAVKHVGCHAFANVRIVFSNVGNKSERDGEWLVAHAQRPAVLLWCYEPVCQIIS